MFYVTVGASVFAQSPTLDGATACADILVPLGIGHSIRDERDMNRWRELFERPTELVLDFTRPRAQRSLVLHSLAVRP